MCIVSMVTDYWRDRTLPGTVPNWPQTPGYTPPLDYRPVTREEFDRLKKSIEELKTLIKAAKNYDEKLGEPHCEQDEKVALIRRLAKLVGVDVEGVFSDR